MNKKCICFIRVSSQQQMLEGQKEKVVAAAMSDGYQLDEIAVVEGIESAIKLKEEKRETLNEMKQLIADYPTIDSIYVFAIDRLARRVSVILSVKDFLLEHKINLVFLNPHRLNTIRVDEKGERVEDELTSMMLLFLAYGAEMEMKLKLARWKVAKDIMRNNNKFPAGKPLYGYKKLQDKSIIVDEELGDIVRYVYIEYAKGKKSMFDLYKELVAKGVLEEKKKSAAVNFIAYLLKNPAYYGAPSKHNKVKNGMVYPPIVTKEIWEEANRLIQHRGTAFKLHHKNIYYAKGLVRLMNTGYMMQANITGLNYKSSQLVVASVNINAIDSLVWKITRELQIIRLGLKTKQQKYDYAKEIAENEEKIEKINELLESIHDRQKRAFKMYVAGKVNEQIYNDEISEIQNDENTWNYEIAKLQSEIQQFKMKGDEMGEKPIITQSRLKKLSDEEKKELIDEIIKEVQVTKNDDRDYDISIITNDRHLGDIYNELCGNPTYHYTVSGGVIHLVEKSDVIEIEISDIIEKRITTDYKRIKKVFP